MTLNNLLNLFADKNCETIYIKELVQNNNSKQQIYVARGNIQVLSVFPVNEFKTSKNENTLHASCTFYWLSDEGSLALAPNAKFILYPQYPEVRFSGFIQGCLKAPSNVLNHKVAERYLFFGISKTSEIIGYAADAQSEVSLEFFKMKDTLSKAGILFLLALKGRQIVIDTKNQLLKKLKEIYLKGWINSKQLKPGFIIADCNESRCGGLTLEAELGIIQNGKSEPDYLGWEIKQFGVKKFHLINGSRVTLMTPEPDGGFYKDSGGIEFVKKYGYVSPTTIDRMDFTGYHKYDIIQKKSGLTLHITGYDFAENKIIDYAGGGICLLDNKGNVAASWSFAKMLIHWTKKHAKASYIPSLLRQSPQRQYQYSNKIIIGEETNFSFFMSNLLSGRIFYDPGIHIDNVSTKAKLKPRSQFRISSRFINKLYDKVEIVDLDTVI